MTTPRRDHEWVQPAAQPPTIPTATLSTLEIKALRAELRALEARRKTSELQAQLDTVAARLDHLEHPPAPESPAAEPGPVVVPRTDGPAFDGPGDVAWVIDSWRERDWTT